MKVCSINMISNAGLVADTKPRNINYSNNFTNFHNYEGSYFFDSKPVGLSSIKRAYSPAAIITFGGNRGKDGGIFVGAELPPYWKKGGVATVMNDYPGPHVIPYYNGKIEYDPETGIPVEKSKITVHKLGNGKPIFTNQDLNVKSIEEVITDGNYWELETVSEQKMQWGLEEQDDISLYKIIHKDSEIEKAAKEGKILPDHYMVFTDATAKMPAPYADNSYSFGFNSNAGEVKTWQGDSYAKFGKALVETLPSVLEQHNVETVVCSDAQSAYVTHWMAKKVLNGDPLYNELKPSYVKHNVGMGYTGSTSNKNMTVNLAENVEQLNAIKQDSGYLEALKSGTEDSYFTKFVSKTHDALGHPNATMIPLLYHEQGFVSAATTVSEEYANAIAENPEVAPEIFPIEKELAEKGLSGGILNPLNDPNIDPYKPLPLAGFGKDQEVEINGVKETVKSMKIFSQDMSLDNMLEVKKENMKNLFNRLSGKYNQSTVLTGLPGKKVKLMGNIDNKWIQAIDRGEDVKLFVSWGRGDFQKGLDSVLGAFEKFAKTDEGKNSVLVLGGELDNANSESKNIRLKLKALLKDASLEGRICFMDGFAPGYALASAANAAVFPSRFAPCELTDLEAQKYFCTSIVTNTQGLKQKNFDPRIEAEKAKSNAYKTVHEYQMGPKKLAEISEEFEVEYKILMGIEKNKLIKTGVNAKNIESLAEKNVLKSDEYKMLYRECADNIIVDELAQAMHCKATETKEISELMYSNHKNLKTGWHDNGALHPSGKSSWQLYVEKHFAPDPKKPTESLFTFDTHVMETYKESLAKAVDKSKDEGKKVVKKATNGLSKGGKIGIGLAAVGVLIASCVYASKNKKPNSNMNSDGDEFQKSRVSA